MNYLEQIHFGRQIKRWNIYRRGKNIRREELKSKDFIIKNLLQTIKVIKTKSISVQPIPSCMSRSKANLILANNSVAIEDIYSNNDERTNTLFLFLTKQT